jgi:arylformamidase
MLSLDAGDVCNLTRVSMCAHNGTHVDAPYHFLNDGKTIDRMGLEPYVGDCWIARCEGDVTAEAAERIMKAAENSGAGKRVLIAGKAVVTVEAARVFAAHGIMLIGNESQTVGPEDVPKEVKEVHLILLGAGVTLLEGVVLDGVDEGKYFLSAAPLNFGGCDGAPCRAYLIKQD